MKSAIFTLRRRFADLFRHEIAQTVDSVGGQMDASTGKENANYAIKVLDEHLALAVDVDALWNYADPAASECHRMSSTAAPRISVRLYPWLNVTVCFSLSARACGIGSPVLLCFA